LEKVVSRVGRDSLDAADLDREVESVSSLPGKRRQGESQRAFAEKELHPQPLHLPESMARVVFGSVPLQEFETEHTLR
jgi:hypothetical protein